MNEIIHPEPPGRLRRIIAFPLTLLVIEVVVVVGVAGGYSVLARKLGVMDKGPVQFAGALGLGLLVIAAYLALTRWIERKQDPGFALAGAPRELGLGLLAGTLLFSAMAGLVALLGGFEVLGLRGAGAIWAMLSMAVTSSVFEETLFRGVLFRHIEAMLGSWGALGITSALFGAAHLGNPDSSPFAALAIAMEAGILLGAAYMLTRRLWLAIGIHAAWNFTQGWLFSIPVSGGEVPLGLLITRRQGPEWLTGGDFGLEASVVAMVVATLAGVLILRRAIANGELRPPMWKR